MRALRRSVLAAALAGTIACAVASPAAGADAPLHVGAALTRPLALGAPAPAHFWLTPRQALARARRTPTARRVLAADRRAAPTVFAPDLGLWTVVWTAGGRRLGEVRIEDRTGRELDGGSWAWPRVRAPFDGGRRRMELIMLALSLALLAAFLDLRRPLRLANLDLLALVAPMASFALFDRGRVLTAYPLLYPVLGYLCVRLALVGLGAARAAPLRCRLPDRWLLWALGALLVARAGYNVVLGQVNDVGYAGIFGADSIIHHWPLYVADSNHLDTYGPIAYLAYLPFNLVFPLGATWQHDALLAGHAASIAFDLLAVGALLLLGRRLRPGPAGARLGLVLAFAWACCPWTFFVLALNTNDALVTLLVVGSIATLASPALRGALLALAAGVKLAPLALVPLIVGASGRRNVRAAALCAGAFAAVLGVAVLAYMPAGGPRELYDATLGFQLHRRSFHSLWGQHPGLEWLQTALKVAVAALALGAALPRRPRGPAQVAALAAALVAGLQLTVQYWSFVYLVWFFPLAMAALCAAPAAEPAGVAEPIVPGRERVRAPEPAPA